MRIAGITIPDELIGITFGVTLGYLITTNMHPQYKSFATRLDKFGVKQIYKTVGREWYSTKWKNGKKRILHEDDHDPYDSNLYYVNGSPSTATFTINGDGTASFNEKCTSHRLFVNGPWNNTEQTIYIRVRGMANSLQLRSRSNHHGPKGLPYGTVKVGDKITSCGFGNYISNWSLDNGTSSAELEIIHDLYARDLGEKPSLVTPRLVNKWIGFKQITRTGSGGKRVKVEGYVLLDVNTQNWILDTSWTFDGKNAPATTTGFESNLSACTGKGDKLCPDINAHQLWTKSGKWGWMRMNTAENVDLKYWSIREIAPLP